MSICTLETMTNNHEISSLGRLRAQLRVWADRWNQRHELTRWSERELHDVGVSWSEVAREADKPFWRA